MWYLKHIAFLMLILKSLGNSCDCDKKHLFNNIKGRAKSNISIGKRDLDTNGHTSTENYPSLNTSGTDVRNMKNNKFNVSHHDIKVKSNDHTPEYISDMCPSYKNVPSFDIDKMADVWQTAYYRMSEKVSCFRIHIRKTTEKERKKYLGRYGDFNKTVDWNNCLLEIKSGERQFSYDKKHFLQGNSSGRGVFANVIFDEKNRRENTSRIHLHDESADQWLVIKNLLLMRDCENGDVAVFSRSPHQPRLEDVWDALKVFGEVAMNGTLACLEDDRVQRSIKNVLQEVLFRFRLF